MAIESKNKKEKKKKYKSWAFILYISDEQQEHTYLFDSMREHKKKAVYAHASHVYSQDLSPSICLSFCRAHSFSAFTSTLTLLFLIE